MKTLSIQNEIIKNYKNLSKISQIPVNKEKGTAYIWSLTNKKNNNTGFITQTGNISLDVNKKSKTGNMLKDFVVGLYNSVTEYFNTEVQINHTQVQKIKKPLFMSWSKAFDRVNDMLKNTMENIDNKNIVEKRQIGLSCFSKTAANRINEINKKH